MSGQDTLPLARGETQLATRMTAALGKQVKIPNVGIDSTTGKDVVRDDRLITLQLVENDSGGTLTPRQVCGPWKADKHGKAVAGKAGADSRPVGVVDFYYAGTIPDKHAFWLIVDDGPGSPAEFINGAAAALAQSDIIKTAANGKVIEQVAAPADETAVMVEVNAKVGYVEETVAATADLIFKGVFKPS